MTQRHTAAVSKDCELTIRRLLSSSDTHPATELLYGAIVTVGQMLDWAATEFWVIDEVGNVLRRHLSWTDGRNLLPSDLPDRLEYGVGMPGRAWQTSEAVWAKDLDTDADARAQTHDWGQLRSAVTVPVPIGSVTRGVLACYSAYTEHPDDVRTAVMTGIAAHIGQFLERRRGRDLSTALGHSRDEYIALVGHEIRTPLTSIESYTALLLDDPDPPLTDRIEMLQVMQRNTATLHTIIDKLLDIAGMQSGHVTVSARRMDLNEVVRAAATAIRTGCADKDVTFDVDLPDETFLWADPHRLTQVVDELLANALAWADDGSHITVAVSTDGLITQLAVSNTGQVHPRSRTRTAVPALLPHPWRPHERRPRHRTGTVTGPDHRRTTRRNDHRHHRQRSARHHDDRPATHRPARAHHTAAMTHRPTPTAGAPRRPGPGPVGCRLPRPERSQDDPGRARVAVVDQ